MTGKTADAAREGLRRTGARVTPARVRVLAALMAAGRPLSHHEIEALEGEPLDRVTLYRVLDWLVAQGLARRMAGEDRVWRFLAGAEVHAGHAHFHCGGCGAVSCLESQAVQGVRLPRGFRSDAVELTVRGRCAACARQGA